VLTRRACSVVTGATAGIGKDFALQLAGAGFNVFLASRTLSKLTEIADEISNYIPSPFSSQADFIDLFIADSLEAKYPKCETKVHSIDFAAASQADYAALGLVLDKIDVGVLSEPSQSLNHKVLLTKNEIQLITSERVTTSRCSSKIYLIKIQPIL
jgi:NAD(P)-dependent dehydrogenase (short-subunit alcohol dehydrogenase family)